MRFPLRHTVSMGAYIARNKIAGRKRFPLVLMLEPLHACNLACSGCGRIREYSSTLSSTMSVDECLESARESGAPVVSICGGEPLIYAHVGELVDRLVHMGRQVYLCTNGLLLKQKLDEFHPTPRLILNIHLDGQADVHDAIVCRKGVFDTAVEGIVAAKEKGFLVSTNTTVYRETDMADVEALLERMSELRVDTHMISPAYDYEAVKSDGLFLTRRDTIERFRDLERIARRFPLSDTPIYIDFLTGKREMPCAAWGSPTRNPVGWRSPCYMLADTHYRTFHDLMTQTDWDAYGPGRDERCRDCMMHCGFEPSAVLLPGKGIRDLLRLAAWQMS